MNKTLLFLTFLLLPVFVISQVTQSFNYQTVVRDSDGNVIKNQQVNFDIQILVVDSIIYFEEHSINTGNLGIVNLGIGRGNNPTTDFSKIDWSKGPYKIRTRLNGEEVGVSDIVTVPQAFYAEVANSSLDWVNLGDSVLYQESMGIGLGTDKPENKLHIHSDDIPVGIKITREGSPFPVDLNIAQGATPDLDYGFLGLGGNTKLRGGGRTSSFGGTIDLGNQISASRKISLRANNDIVDNWIESFDENGERVWLINMLDRSEDNRFAIWSELDRDYHFWIDRPGRTHVKTLQIHGGGDGAEYFNFSTIEKIEAGAIVIIDENNPRKLTTTKTPYDRRVAGIISGAGGVKPGITLKQEEVLDGQELLSLWGRVYVKATAANGKIKPGDFLTSSNFEGYAMKATKKKKSRGAIIGKALSSLDNGEGLVLILIQPQ